MPTSHTDSEPVNVTFLYFDSCPNWKRANTALAEAATLEHRMLAIRYELVETHEAAEALQFRGSPTILVEGVDPFAADDAPVGLSCRVYRTESGVPTVEQLRKAMSGTR